MKIGVLGINYKSAEIAVREWVSKACRMSIPRDGEIAEGLHAVLLSTCNRCEIYFSCDHLADAHSVLLNLLRREIDTAFEQHLYSFFGVDCFTHLAKVTSGLDSVIIAESEIQRQVKMAYEQTLLYYSLPSCMHFLFQKSLKLGKQIRSSFALSQNQVTIPKILFQLSEQFVDLPVLFIGNSEINRKVITYFHRQGMRKNGVMHALFALRERNRRKGEFSPGALGHAFFMARIPSCDLRLERSPLSCRLSS